MTGILDGLYKWNCLATDNSSQSSWGKNLTTDVKITVDLDHHIPSTMVNNVNTTRWVILSYSDYLNNSLTLGNLTIYEADGELYYNKNMSTSSKFNANSLMIHPQLINITPSEIFDNNFVVNNTAGLNLSITYYYKGNEYMTKENVTIKVVSGP